MMRKTYPILYSIMDECNFVEPMAKEFTRIGLFGNRFVSNGKFRYTDSIEIVTCNAS